MFSMYDMVLDKEKCLPFGIPIFLVSVYYTIYHWVETNKNTKDFNLNLVISGILFNFVGTILLMGFGIIITFPVTIAYGFMILSIQLFQKSFCGYDTPEKVAFLLTPAFFLGSLAGGFTNWFNDEEAAIGVFMGVYVVLSLIALLVNYKDYQLQPPVFKEEQVKKSQYGYK